MSNDAEVRQLNALQFKEETSELLQSLLPQSRRVLNRVSDALEAEDEFRLFAVMDAGVVIGAVCLDASDFYLTLAGSIPDRAAPQLIHNIVAEFGSEFDCLRGCDGPPEAVLALTKAQQSVRDCEVLTRPPLEMMILEHEPKPPIGVPGTLRAVERKDRILPTLALWFKQFEQDTQENAYNGTDGHCSQITADLAAAAGRRDLFVWVVKEKPVAMVILGRSRPKQVFCVFTVPHHRGRGYGQAATAAACAEFRKRTGGAEPIMLSAVSKFGASRVYERCGFRSAGWLHGVAFQNSAAICA
mmetsp:Transcript_17454/g.31490  ORF Transcript_17454/g.31490 Transcript_17454/m.31490 type:complete len:300 (+) Transcript_17454:54-953(+)